MDYEDAIKMADPPSTIKSHLFEKYIKPYLKKNPDGDLYDYFLHEGYQAWRFNIKSEDIQNMLFVESICEELLKQNENDLRILIENLLEERFEVQKKLHQSEADYYNTAGSANVDQKFSAALKHYKTFYEGSLRLWATVPFYYVSKLGIETKGTTPDTFVQIAASEKLFTLKNMATILPKGDVKKLVEGFNNEIRNAGEGHDRYVVTDNDTILLSVIDPKTGKHKGSGQIELTYSQLENKINECRKRIWILRNGVYLFLNNNPLFRAKLRKTKPLTLREIKSSLDNFADIRWLDLNKFDIDKDRKNLLIEVSYFKKRIGRASEILFGSGEKYDVVSVRNTMDYHKEAMHILQQTTYLFKNSNYAIPNIKIRVYNDKKIKIGEAEFNSSELESFITKKGIPEPNKGKLPEGSYSITSEAKVPYGNRAFFEKILKAKGMDVVS